MKHAWVAVFAISCGGGGSDHAPVALADFATQLGHSYCAKEFACCTDAEVMMDFGSFKVGGQPITTQMQCEQFYAGFLGSFLTPEVMDSMAKGRATYDADAAGGCLGAIDALSCSAFGAGAKLGGDDQCEPYLIPLVADGGACAQSYECMQGSCVGATTSPPKDGQCKPIPTAGQPCDLTCAHGLRCAFDMTSSTNICQSLLANGAHCTSNDACASAYCDGLSSSSDGMCGDKPARCDGR